MGSRRRGKICRNDGSVETLFGYFVKGMDRDNGILFHPLCAASQNERVHDQKAK